MAIGVGALCSAPVRRLRKAIPDLIPKKYLDDLHIMEVLMDSRENHKKYRECLKTCPSPAVPYFGEFIFVRSCTLYCKLECPSALENCVYTRACLFPLPF